MGEKYMVKIQEFLNSYYNYLELKKEVHNMPKTNEVLYLTFLSGCTKKFELLFDQSWKALQAYLIDYHGVATFTKGSPRDVLKKAAELEIIADDLWLDMLLDRNSGTHEYKEMGDLEDYIDKIFSVYDLVFRDLCEKFLEHKNDIAARS